MARKLIVEIVGDSASLEKAFARSSKSATKFNRDISQASRGTIAASGAFQSFGRSVAFASGSFLGAAGVAAGLKSVVTAASDMNETVSKTNDVFGENAAAVKAWSQTLVESFGLSSRQALDTASSFGALFKPMGIVGAEAAQQSEQLTQLGADLAAFYNTDVQSALDAIRSGIVGESEPLRQYGVLLSETRVQQQALVDTGKKHATQLTAQEKALARIKIIFHDTTVAQGNFAKTSKGAAEQTKIFKARIDDLKVSIGEGLLPTVNKLLDVVNRLFADDDKLSTGTLFGRGDFIRNKGMLQQFLSIKEMIKLSKVLQEQENLRRLKGPAGKPGGVEMPPGMVGPLGEAPVEQAKRSAQQLNDFFDAMVSRRLFRGGFKPLAQQLVQLRQVAALITQRIKITKDITRRLRLEDQVLEILAQEKTIRAQLAQDATDALSLNIQKAGLTTTMTDDIAALQALQANLVKRIKLEGDSLDLEQQLVGVQGQIIDARKQAAEQARAAREQAAAAREAAQFRALGLGPGGADLAPSITALKKQLTKVRDSVKGTILDTKANRGLFKTIASELAGHFGALTDNVKDKIKEMLDAIDQQLSDHARNRTAFRHLSAQQFVDSLGLNLTPEQRRRIGIAFTGTSAGGAAPRRGLAFAGVTVNGDVHVHGVQNPKAFEEELTRRGKARSHRRRGRQ